MQLVDQFLRKINYLRVSVTDRCDLRCVYCMKEKMNFLPKNEILSLSTKGESKIGPYRVFKMINESNINKAILAAVLPTTGKTFYIKLTASITGVAELELVFQKFCSSIGFLKN